MEAASALNSWTQAFEEYPIVTTRNIEKQLRGSIVRDKDKLRALVGGNYRDLLATAEQIVTVDGQTKAAEAQISALRQSCKPVQYVRQDNLEQTKKQTLVAELNLLDRCLAGIVTNLKQSLLLPTARLLVIARLLHRSLNDTDTSLKYLERVLEKLSSLRRLLLHRVDARLADPRSTLKALVEAACAYCLATSCSAVDATRHFSHLRLEVIRQQALDVQGTSSSLKRTFSYYVQSLQTTKQLLGRQLPEALGNLQKRPLLQDSSIQETDVLDLGGVLDLISPEIRNFTPYIKRSQSIASKEDVDEFLALWSKSAFDLIVQGLRQALDGLTDLKQVFEARTLLLSTWLAVCYSSSAHAGILQDLRTLFNRRVNVLIEHKAAVVVVVGEGILASLSSAHAKPNIWDETFVSMSLGKGASRFQQQLRARHLGISGALRTKVKAFSEWVTSIQSVQTQIEELKRIRWHDKVEEADEEDETTTTITINALAQEDPQIFSTKLNSATSKSLSEFENQLQATGMRIINEDPNIQDTHCLLRVLREVQNCLELSIPFDRLEEVQRIVPSLQRTVATDVVKQLSARLRTNRKSAPKPAEQASIPSDLPSPRAFRALYQLCAIMADSGGIDLWTEDAVVILKEVVHAEVFDESNRPYYMQSSFDELYLKAALSVAPRPGESAAKEESEEQSKAVEYWTRTKLLFGLLS